MTTVEIKTNVQDIIEHLDGAQLAQLLDLLNKKFPEQAKQSYAPLKERPIGLRKGSLKYMAEDFDAPLDCFKDYMPE